MTIEQWCYVETSALLAALLESEATALGALAGPARFVSSPLTFAEAARALMRQVVLGSLPADQAGAILGDVRRFERRCARVPIDDSILGRLWSPFPLEPVRGLDAIHLATALALGEPPHRVTFISRDRRVRANAQALGFALA